MIIKKINKENLITDFKTMKVKDVMKKYNISKSSADKLKKELGLTKKLKPPVKIILT